VAVGILSSSSVSSELTTFSGDFFGEAFAGEFLTGNFFGLGGFFFDAVGYLMILELEETESDGVVEMKTFLAGAFLMAGAFFGAADFLTDAFLMGAALGAAGFLAGAFLARDFLAAMFLVGDVFTTRAVFGV
jgi:hypothetical protein